MSDQQVSQAAEYIRAGKNIEARQILMQVIKENPRNEAAWLYLVQTLPTDALRISALEQCLKYFPQSQKARLGLERLNARQSAPVPPASPADQPPTPPFLDQDVPPQQPPGDLPPVPLFMPAEDAGPQPPASASLESKPLHPKEPEKPAPSILAGLARPGSGDAAAAEQTNQLEEDIEDLSASSGPVLESGGDQPPSSQAIHPRELEELRAAGARGRPRLTRRSALRAVLIVFYAVVLFGGGYAVWQRYGSDITAWFKGLPQSLTGSVSPQSTSTPLPTPSSTTSLAVPEDTGPGPRRGLGEILYLSEREGLSDLYIDHLDGQGPILLIRSDSPSMQIFDPAWSLDGHQIAFVRGEGQKTDLFTAASDGSGLVVQTNDHAGNAHPSWAPDGDRIVFVSQRDGGQDLYILTISTGAVQRLTEKAGKNDSPAWSPDGSRIAFVSDREGFMGLYLVNPDGSAPVLLSDPAQSVSNPAWSPDGQWLAFSSASNNDRLLYVFSKDGVTQKRITFSPGVDDHPSWSPDGAWIIFSSERIHAGQPTLFMARSDGKDAYQFDTDAHLDHSPAWSPVIKK